MVTLRVVVLVVCPMLILAILHDAFEVMLLPRRVKNKLRIVRLFFDVTWAAWSGIGNWFEREEARYSFLALYGPLSLVLMLVVWAVGLMLGFGGIFTAIEAPDLSLHRWLNHWYFSGVTFFTLGYGDIVPHTPWGKIAAVVEAGTGLGFIAMVIGYLPVIYQLFSRREGQVLTLDAIAGSPPSAVTLVSRFGENANWTSLDDFLLRWQLWCADLLESQLSYPMLAFYRSQHDNQSWLAALTVMMDACVLIMVGLTPLPNLQARLTFATARLATIEMGRVLGVNPLALAEDRLPAKLFARLSDDLAVANLLFREDDAEVRLAAFRATYEPFLNGLSAHLLLPLPAWLPQPGQLDNWTNTPRGRSAKLLFDSIEAKPQGEAE